jgi:outer membrane PBP1 activator LpoA protein
MTNRLSVPALVVAILAALSLTACASATQTARTQAEMRAAAEADQSKVWACHGNKKLKWIRVATAAGDAHRRHGDRLTHSWQNTGSACTR